MLGRLSIVGTYKGFNVKARLQTRPLSPIRCAPPARLLDVLHEYACGGLGRDGLSSRPFRRFGYDTLFVIGASWRVVEVKVPLSQETGCQKYQ